MLGRAARTQEVSKVCTKLIFSLSVSFSNLILLKRYDRAEVSEKIARMKVVQRGLVKADYNDQRRFQVREIEVNGKVVSRLMKIDTNLKYLPSEDLFNEIYDLHVGSGHCGRDLLNKKIKEKFANVTIENISAFLKTCQFCTTKRKSSEKKELS